MIAWILAPLVLGIAAVAALPRRAAPPMALLALTASAAVAAGDVRALLDGQRVSAFGGALALDPRGAVVLMLVLGLGLLAGLVSTRTETRRRRFYALLLAFTATMSVAALADNMGILWAAVEATTLTSALLVGHRRTKEATEASWKYLILSSTGITLAFVATALLSFASVAAGPATLSWTRLLATGPLMDEGLMTLVVVLATVGYGTKAGLVPLHFWLADAHSEAPSPVSALLSGVLLSCALLALDRIARVAAAAGAPVAPILLAFGAASVVVGGALVLGARNYKRMLAHSSVENMGLVTFALGIGTPLALAGAYLHILTHGVAKALAFFSAGRVHHHLDTKLVADARGILARAPVAGGGFLLGILALAGAPLLGPFTSKLLILGAAVSGVAWGWTAVVVAGIGVAFVGFMRQAAAMMPGERPTGVAAAREPWSVTLALVILGAVSIVLGVGGPALLGPLLGAIGVATGGGP